MSISSLSFENDGSYSEENLQKVRKYFTKFEKQQKRLMFQAENMPDRDYAYIKPFKKLTKLNQRIQLYTFDIETNDGLIGNDIFCASIAYNSNKGYQYYQSKGSQCYIDCMNFLLEQISAYKSNKYYAVKTKRKTVVYVHNLSFESFFIRKFFENIRVITVDKKTEVERLVKPSETRIGKANELAISYKEFNLYFVDSFQIFNKEQEKVEKDFCSQEVLEKYAKQQTIDVKAIFEKMNCLEKEKRYIPTIEEKNLILEHNRNDVICLLDIMINFRNSSFKHFKLDILSKSTMAQLAWLAFRSSLEYTVKNPFVYQKPKKDRGILREKNKHKITVNEEFQKEVNNFVKYDGNIPLYDFVNSAYYGGRTEIFDTRYHENVSILDVNNLYGYAMYKLKYGIDNYYMLKDENALYAEIEKNTFGVIYAYIIPTQDEYYPILPYRDKSGCIYFTNQSRFGAYTVLELNYALKRGYTIYPIFGYFSALTEPIYRKHIELCTKLRDTTNPVDKECGKRYSNLAYGKSGQKMYDKRTTLVKEFQSKEDLDHFMELKGMLSTNPSEIFKTTKNGLTFYDNRDINVVDNKIYKNIPSYNAAVFMDVFLACYTTAYARLVMYDFIEICKWHKVPIFGMDTDSIAIPSEFEDLFEISSKLGKMKIEHKCESIQFLAPKLYLYREKGMIKLKGKGIPKREKDKLQLEPTFDIIIEKMEKGVNIQRKYAKYATQLKSGTFQTRALSKITIKQQSFDNVKRLFHKDGSSEAWNDTNIDQFEKIGFKRKRYRPEALIDFTNSSKKYFEMSAI